MDSWIEIFRNLGILCLGMTPAAIGYLWLDCNWDLKLFTRALGKFLFAIASMIAIITIIGTILWISLNLIEILLHESRPNDEH